MIQIRDLIISLSVFEQDFACDVAKCKGKCCEAGDSGAPLEEEEKYLIKKNFPLFKKYMQGAGVNAVESKGFFYLDDEEEWVTTLIDGKECAYTYKENGIFFCAIEKAWNNQEINFRKPISCHLYPIRTKQFKNFQAVNYDQWNICSPACQNGKEKNIHLLDFLKDALVRKFGDDLYEEIKIAFQSIHSKST